MKRKPHVERGWAVKTITKRGAVFYAPVGGSGSTVTKDAVKAREVAWMYDGIRYSACVVRVEVRELPRKQRKRK